MDDGETFVYCMHEPLVDTAVEKRKIGVYGPTTTTLEHLAEYVAWDPLDLR